MRIHLIISRHGLPVTRILWTTTASSSREYGSHQAVSTSEITSSRNPNVAFANGGYTVAQLLEDVNEVVPLETEANVFDPEQNGQWGLEDYVVEVGGSECLHFMEVDGLLREGDEVVIRALQLPDLRARRLCGRHQIASDGKHLIDGVPFGMPFYRRVSTNRPAINIPPRKKRRTVLSSWDHGAGFGQEHSLLDEEGDGDWQPPSENGFGKELSILPVEHDMSMGTVIRHPVDHSADEDSEEDDPDFEEDELESELKALKEDFEVPSTHVIDPLSQGEGLGASLRSSSGIKRPASAQGQRRSSLAGASSLSSKRSRGEDSSPRASKAVRFNKGENHSRPRDPSVQSSTEESSDSSSESDSNSDSDSDSSSDSSAESSEEDEDMSMDGPGAQDSESSSSSSSSSDSSESEDEAPQKPTIVNPPGRGSLRTKKSNTRVKLRRRLSKLKEMGLVDQDADFAALRAWEEANGGWTLPEEQPNRRETLNEEFEARRQKLLRDLAAGGVDVEETSEKENVPPQSAFANDGHNGEISGISEATQVETPEAEKAHRRHLDIASSRRLLFGSLGMRTPKTKEEEEATRKKMAAKATNFHARERQEEANHSTEADFDVNDTDWQSKLDIRATECVFDDVTLSAPPFPFTQRWDEEANAIIRQRKGWGKKRKRKQRIQVYHGEGEDEEYHDDGYYQDYAENSQLNYDEEPNADYAGLEDNGEEAVQDTEVKIIDGDLPLLPRDPSSLPGLLECESRPGAIIAFRQLDMSKETNWQPRMSDYKVAEVLEADGAHLSLRLAIRDRRPKAEEQFENDEPRTYSGFEMPGFDDEDDDGHRELEFLELNEPKLIKVAPVVVEDSDDEARRKGDAQGSNVSVVQDSMQNPIVDMDLDETTFATLATAVSHLDETPRSRRSMPQIEGSEDDGSDSPAIPSPSFSGFHSARSSPGTRSRTGLIEETNLDGHTLIGETQSSAVDTREVSGLSFLSANESPEHDRQPVEDPHLSRSSSSGAPSLISQVHTSQVDGPAFSLFVTRPSSGSRRSTVSKPRSQSSIEDSPGPQYTGYQKARTRDLSDELPAGEPSTDHADQETRSNDQDDEDSVLHSERQSTHIFSPHDSSPDNINFFSSRRSTLHSGSESSRKPPTSAQHEPVSQSSNITGIKTESLPDSNRSKGTSTNNSQLKASQTSEFIDLTTSPAAPGTPGELSSNDAFNVPASSGKKSTRRSSSRQPQTPSAKPQHLSEVVVKSSPVSSQKKKRRLSRKF